MKIISIVGARPQFIKAAVVSKALRSREGVKEIIVHTGQHYDENMSQVFFEEMEIPPPDYYLGVGSGPHGQQTGRMLERIEEVLLKEKPDWVLVYGDTNSTLAGALGAAKVHIPVAHVEAGLRSFNRRMPEEINRVLTDHLAELLFAPTETAVENLLREGIAAEKIHLVGDVMYDAALYYGAIAEKKSSILNKLGLKPREYILATVHRAENTDDPARLEAIFGGLQLAAAESGLRVVIPLHPRTKAALGERRVSGVSGILGTACTARGGEQRGGGKHCGLLAGVFEDAAWDKEQESKAERTAFLGNLLVIEPVGYLDMLMLEKNARLIATDSGGVQKEAFFFRVPCVTLREETEWVELVKEGWNQLVPPTDAATVAQEIQFALRKRSGRGREESLAVQKGESDDGLYGSGRAAEKIGEIVLSRVIW